MNRLTLATVCTLMALSCLTVVARAAAVDVDFDAANRAYGAGKYAEAASGYESILRQNGYSASVLFNLGNAYYRQGKTGAAILNYERALRLSPRDPDIQANLKYARSQAGLSLSTPQSWRALMQELTPNQWSWAAAAAFSLLCALGLVRLVRAEWIQRVGVSAGLQTVIWSIILSLNGLALVLLVTCGVLSVWNNREAVITAKQTGVLVSPFDKMESIATLSEGESVNVEKKYGDYVLVRYEKGKSGWVLQTQLATVDPDLLKAIP